MMLKILATVVPPPNTEIPSAPTMRSHLTLNARNSVTMEYTLLHITLGLTVVVQ